jgi:hypothetical protein
MLMVLLLCRKKSQNLTKRELFGKAHPIFFNGEEAPVRLSGTYTDEELALWEKKTR